MNRILIYPAGNTPALAYACRILQENGFKILKKPAPDVTHLLLPVPSFESDGRIRGGGILEHILWDLPENVTVIGGNLNHPALDTYKKLDLLKEPAYVAQNAAITADGAVRVAAEHLPVVFDGCKILILGWGRIGKCLAQKLKAMGASVTVAARKESDIAMLRALGYDAVSFDELPPKLSDFRVIFNTVPALMLSEELLSHCLPDCVKIELASTTGIAGKNVISARGLPNLLTPESSGLLIGKTIIPLLKRKEPQL